MVKLFQLPHLDSLQGKGQTTAQELKGKIREGGNTEHVIAYVLIPLSSFEFVRSDR